MQGRWIRIGERSDFMFHSFWLYFFLVLTCSSICFSFGGRRNFQLVGCWFVEEGWGWLRGANLSVGMALPSSARLILVKSISLLHYAG